VPSPWVAFSRASFRILSESSIFRMSVWMPWRSSLTFSRFSAAMSLIRRSVSVSPAAPVPGDEVLEIARKGGQVPDRLLEIGPHIRPQRVLDRLAGVLDLDSDRLEQAADLVEAERHHGLQRVAGAAHLRRLAGDDVQELLAEQPQGCGRRGRVLGDLDAVEDRERDPGLALEELDVLDVPDLDARHLGHGPAFEPGGRVEIDRHRVARLAQHQGQIADDENEDGQGEQRRPDEDPDPELAFHGSVLSSLTSFESAPRPARG
jgi:hypothetical protein